MIVIITRGAMISGCIVNYRCSCRRASANRDVMCDVTHDVTATTSRFTARKLHLKYSCVKKA